MKSSPDTCSRWQALQVRARVLRAIRRFFDDMGFLEVETPVWIFAPALELHLDAMPAGAAYLRTSPELHMKRLLAAGFERIYQIGPCFRAEEHGPRHRCEFTMLEWYHAGADYLEILQEMQQLLGAVWAETAAWCPHAPDVRLPWRQDTVQERFLADAGWDPLSAFDADRFDLDLVTKIEPGLPRDRPVVLMDYPVETAALARIRPGNPAVAERWELYLGGMELANAFSELTDAAEQRQRFVACAEQRAAAGRPVYPLDEAFLQALAQGMPSCGGVALGVDRLMMALTGCTEIGQVRVEDRNLHSGAPGS